MHEKLSLDLVGSCSMVPCMHRGSLEAGAQTLVARQYIPSLWHAVDQSIDFLQWYIIPRLLHMFQSCSLLVAMIGLLNTACLTIYHIFSGLRSGEFGGWISVMPTRSLTSLGA